MTISGGPVPVAGPERLLPAASGHADSILPHPAAVILGLVKSIFHFTLGVELAGAALLTLHWGRELPLATEIIHPERDMALRISHSLSRPNILDFIPLAEEFDLVQVEPLRAKYSVHIIAIKELVPENFVLVPPADFRIKDSDILVILGKSVDIKKIKALQ